jgi:hypothetical protein
MVDFSELDPPAEKYAGDFEGLWYVITKYHMPLNTKGMVSGRNGWGCLNVYGVVEIADPNDYGKYYFKTECEAHVVANNYYDKHGEDYPYKGRWYVAWKREQGVTTVTCPEDIKQEVMEFI